MRRQHGSFLLTAALVFFSLSPGLGRGATFRVGGGTLELGGKLTCDQIDVAAGSMVRGNGTLQGQVTVRGTVSPGGTKAMAAGTLNLEGDVSFRSGSVYLCDVVTHDKVDRLAVSGHVTGSGCDVRITRQTGAIPLGRVVVDGRHDSKYSNFRPAGPDAADWRLETAVPDGDLVLTHMTGDTDGDRLPDWWEDLWFGSRTICDPAKDSDHDSSSNGEEKTAGTDPTRASSVFGVSGCFRPDAGVLTLSWNSAEDRLYTVSRRNTPGLGPATVVQWDAPATPPVNTFTDSAPGSAFFYRITVREP